MSLRVPLEFINQVKLAQKRRFSSQKALANEIGCCRSTITNFLNGRPVHYLNFVEISEKLELDWQAIAYKEEPIPTPPPNIPPQPWTGESQNKDLGDTKVQKVRQHCHDKILYLCGKMQLLDIPQPVDIDNLFVDVNILDQMTNQRWLELSDLLKEFNAEADNFDRLGLGKVRQQPVPGLKVVTAHSKLMVLGKPGAGKTTFLKHIAIECNKGKFQANRIPIFIPLKILAEDAKEAGKFDLLQYIHQEFLSCDLAERSETEAVLNDGRGLILLDGLDEVPDEDSEQLVRQIRRFVRKYHKNQFIISCRIAALKYRFKEEGFAEVEVADFNGKQIEDFAKNWFVALSKENREEGLAKAKQFFEKLTRPKNQQILELAETPILLNLTCLVFQSTGDFPSKRSKLYEQGVDILLKRWDEARGIKRDEVYRSLTLPRKKQLLFQVAAITFEQGDYFLEKHKIQQLIADYLDTLPDAKTDTSEMQLDSEAVLKAIEAQHGLLVEQAIGIYSFSHLTFQEYFTARKIISSFEPEALTQLVNHITEKRWREVFLLAVGMLQPSADRLLLLIKQQIDGLVAVDEKLQQFLMWVNKKSLSDEVPYQPAAVRAFYFALSRNQGRDLALARDLGRNLALDLDLTSVHIRALAHDLELARKSARDLGLDLDLDLDLDLTHACALASTLDLDCALNRTLASACAYIHTSSLTSDLARELGRALASTLNLDHVRARVHTRNLASDLDLARTLASVLNPELKRSLQQLKNQLPDPEQKGERLEEWWKTNSQAWTEQLRAVMISHRNLGHDWQFSYQQSEVLKQYYEVNKLLVDCLNSDCNVTPAVREEIEETLLLPITEIEKRRSCHR